MKRLGFALLPLAAACAMQPTPERLAALAKDDTTPNLCAAILALPPAYATAAQNELTSRSASCDWEQAKAIAETYIARQQAQEQLRQHNMANMMSVLGTSAALLQQAGPKPYPGSPAITNCRWLGSTWTCSSY